MLRTWDYAWWKPVLGILLFLAAALVVVPVLLTPVLAVAVAVQGGAGSYVDRVTEALSLKSVTPASMLYLNLTLASLALIAMGLMRVRAPDAPAVALLGAGRGCGGSSSSPASASSVVALVVSLVVGSFLPATPTAPRGTPNVPTGQLARHRRRDPAHDTAAGAGGGVRLPWLPDAGVRLADRLAGWWRCSASATLFALAHGVQNFPLFFDRFAFGLMAGLVVVLVGGLEAGIALHILNNLLAFGVAIAYDQLDDTLNVLGGLVVAAADHDRAERRLPRPRAARGPQDGAAQHHCATGGRRPR